MIQTGLKCSNDVYNFNIPVLKQIGFKKCDAENFTSLDNPHSLSIPKMSAQISNPPALIKRMADHNLALCGQQGASFFFVTQVNNDRKFRCEIEIRPPTEVIIKTDFDQANER